ncbi:MAG TPA: cadmium resistance transporter [Cyclobacteriaceae bacterium]|nr:cadmium resistance transporter [Cyclobacteriaceae bacterium]
MIQNGITSLLAFVSTNIDDLFILMVFYGSRKYKSSHITTGQYLGITVLVIVALVGSTIGNFVDIRYVGLLGLFPIYLGLKATYKLIKKAPDTTDGEVVLSGNKTDIIAIAGVTIANGGDNIGVYIPLLTTFDYLQKLTFALVFVVMIFIWCQVAKALANHPIMARSLDRYSHFILPVLLFLLGAFIIIESNTIALFTV